MNEEQMRLNDEGRQLWDAKAEFWDSLHGDEGNSFHRTLISPSVEKLLELQPGERVLDVACGSGVMSRRLASLGAQVTAVDFSSELIARAKQRPQQGGEPIQYGMVDATDELALRALGEGQYHALVCTMALMDIPVIEPLFRAAAHLLAPGGRMVIATSHPAFNSNSPVFYAEMADEEGVLTVTRGLKLSAYLAIAPVKAAGAPNEPNPHYYYHRPLQELLGAAFAAGLVLDGLEEPAFPTTHAESSRLLSWYGLAQFPPVLAARLRTR